MLSVVKRDESFFKQEGAQSPRPPCLKNDSSRTTFTIVSLKLSTAWIAWERDHIADVFHPSGKLNEPLKA